LHRIALKAIQWRYYLVYIGTASLWLVIIYFTFPEIKNLTIEEISVIFDRGPTRGGSKEMIGNRVEDAVGQLRDPRFDFGKEGSKGGEHEGVEHLEIYEDGSGRKA
jgi:hypothetical protein